jgi:hypothetical protein
MHNINNIARIRNLKLIVLLALGLLSLTSCTTPKVPRPPSTYLLNTEKSQVQLITELKDMLMANKYEIKTINTQTGFLITKPRRFNVKRPDGSKVSTEQSLSVRQEAGSVTVRANYDCEYIDKEKKLVVQPCHNDDTDVNNRIRRIESALIKQIRQKLEEVVVTPAEKDLTDGFSEKPAQANPPKSQPQNQ